MLTVHWAFKGWRAKLRNLPESEIPDIREYLYVDTPRVQTLLAQFAAGLPQDQTSVRIQKWQASFSKIVGFARERTDSEQENRSLADLHVAMLEEDSEATGMLTDVTSAARVSKNWNRERLHKSLHSGSLIRITAPTQVLDPASFAKLAERLDRVSDDQEFSRMLSKIVDALYGDDLVVRILPCGTEMPKLRFSGTIVDPGNYLAGERSALFSRLGADAQEWTTIASVSRIPQKSPASTSSTLMRIAGEVQRLMEDNPDQIDRAALEVLIQETSRAMETVGLSEAPSWPAISIVPLAIYRHIPMTSIDSSLESEPEE